ncbi:MAG: hypothetical protein RhofKO_11590 [Rhodothermales bacterium]
MERALQRKWTLKAHGQQHVFVKRVQESTEHVLMKAGLWACYLPDYPGLQVEVSIGDKYKPDLVALGEDGTPLLWAEAGKVTPAKVASLTRRYPDTMFVLAKWAMRLQSIAAVYQKARDPRHRAPFHLLSFPSDTAKYILPDATFALPDAALARIAL